jgi:hypothetical protein
VVAMLTWNQSSRAGQAAPVNKVGVVHTSPCLLGTRQALAWATVVQEHVFRPSSSIHLPTGGVSVEQERVVWGRPRAIQFRREFPFVRRIHLVGLRIARWHRSSEPPLPSSPLPWPLPMGAITTLCIVNLERAVAFPTSHMVCVETAPKCIVHRQHASSMLAVYHPPGLQGRPMDGHTVDAQRHPYLSCGRSPPHMYVSIVPVASSSRITPNATTHPLTTLTNAERARPHSHRTEHTERVSYPMTLTASMVGDHRPLRVDPLLVALLAWPRAHG